MQQASVGFKDALRYGSFIIQARLTVYRSGNPTQYLLPISDATVTMDRNSANRFVSSITAELMPTIPPSTLMPTDPSSILAPFGTEIFIETALLTDPAVTATDWVPMGLFAISKSTVVESGTDLVVTLELKDRGYEISRRKLIAPYNIPHASGNFVDEITTLLNYVWAGTQPPLTYNITPTSATVPATSLNENTDPWKAALDMASAAGYELFFDRNGVVTGLPIPDSSTQPVVWNFDENTISVEGTTSHPIAGTPYTTPASIQLEMDAESIYNHVIISGTGTQNAPGSASGSSAPVRAEAKDTDPNSPTYYAGPFGDVPEFKQTSLATTTAVAQAMADNELQAVLADAWRITVSCPPNPLLDVDDVVTVTNARLGLSGKKIVIDQIQTSIKYDALTLITGRVVPGS